MTSQYVAPSLVLLLLHLARITEGYFCSRFFVDIKDRSPFTFVVNDSTPVGSSVQQFERPGTSRKAITFTSGDLKYINYDQDAYALKVIAPLYPRIDETLKIYGTCVDFISLIAYEINIPVSMTIRVVDTNDPPVFKNLPSTLIIPEGKSPGLLNFTVDIDNSYDRRPEFIETSVRISGINTDSGQIGHPPFRLTDDGSLELLLVLDYETGPRAYNVTFRATDRGNPPMTNSSTLRVLVGDVDDMPPAFSHQEPYLADVIGERPIEDRHCFSTSPPIQAHDLDEGLDTPVRYEVSHGTPPDWSEYFSLDSGTGQVCQLTTVPRTAVDSDTGRRTFHNFTFTIRASQVDNSQKFDTASLVIHVRDANEHAPQFDRSLYRETVPEFPKTKSGTNILQVRATDLDHGLNSVFEYSLSPEAYPAFVIDPGSGWISVNNQSLLDRERKETFKFRVFARETDSADQRLDEARVFITVDDINDNRPKFRHRSTTYTIKDTLRPGLLVHKEKHAVHAVDNDQGDNGRIQYQISNIWRKGGGTSLTDLGRFTIDPDSGFIRLAGTLTDLRRRRQHPSYKLKITATDRAREEEERKSAHAFVIIQIEEANDHAPYFADERSDTWLNESVPIGTVVTNLKVFDEDGDEDVYLSYEITSGNEAGKFYVASGGRIILGNSLDRETNDDFTLMVEVTDGPHTARIPVGIHVTDVNDNPPVFTEESYVFVVPEEPEIGTVAGTVRAYDADLEDGGIVSYEIKGSLGNQILAITEDGTLLVRQLTASMDREQNYQIRFKVIASDMGNPSLSSTADVTLELEDRNDNPPVFPYPVYYGWVQEDDMDPRPQVVTLETALNASDSDATFGNRDVWYFLAGEGSDAFDMDPRSADILVRRPGMIDCETMDEYSLTVTAVDRGGRGNSAETKLIINVRDENDNAPEFQNPPYFRTSLDVSQHSVIGKVEARDNDVTKPNNDIIYLLKSGGYGKFGVDYRSGDIYLADDLDREPVMDAYQLEIEALDGGNPRQARQSSVSILVPYNFPPKILQNTTHIRVREDLPPLTSIGKLEAYDRDMSPNGEDLNFFVKDNSIPFMVERHGDIRTKAALDRERAPLYEFEVYVSDAGAPPRTSSAKVTVTIDDINDSPPRFTLSSYEGHVVEDNRNPRPGQDVRMTADIAVMDLDSHVSNRDVRFTLKGDARTLFNINTRTGSLRVSQRAAGQIDREQREYFRLTLIATDQDGYGLSSEADLTIYIDDVNDEVPRFVNRGEQFYVGEHVEVGRAIGKIVAVDPDATEPNNKVIYTLESDSLGKFSVDPYTGSIIPLKGLFFKPRYEVYVLRVAAMDLGYPIQKTVDTVQVRMRKKKFNDHKPEFQGRTVFTVKEEVPVGSVVGVLKAVDEDVGPGAGLTLEIVAPSPVPFKIDSNSGEIRTTERLDADDGKLVYRFVVRAKDHGDPPQEALAHIGIIVEDVNDNPPVFTQPLYHHYASDLYPVGTVIATPFAHDDIDSGDSIYTYRMEGKGSGVYLTMNPANGVVQTTSYLSQLNETQVRFELIAQDVYNPRLFATSQLIVDILKFGKVKKCCCDPPCD